MVEDASANGFVHMNGREVFKFATRVLVSSAEAVLERCGVSVEDIDLYVPHQANVRIMDHAAAKLGIPRERMVVNVDRYGNTSSGSIPLALAEAQAAGRLEEGDLVLMTGMGAGLTWGSTLMEWTGMKPGRVAFCFPGQGSLEVGMGREVATAVPEARDVFERCSAATGMDLMRLCFEGTKKTSSRPRSSSRRSSRRAWPSWRRSGSAGIKPDFVVGHSVGEFAALAAAGALRFEEAVVLVRERGLAMADAARKNPGSMAAILGLDDEVVERICRRILNVWPANYNCPGQIVVSGENPAIDEACAEAERERCSARDQASRLGRVPQSARRARGRPAAPGARSA